MEMILLNDIDKTNKSFEDIKHNDENGVEFWYAREIMPILQYSNWQNFEKIINKAKMCHAKIVILVCLNILLMSISCQNVPIMRKLRLMTTN